MKKVFLFILPTIAAIAGYFILQRPEETQQTTAVPSSSEKPAVASGFNYAEALQKSLYFFEAQQSGKLSPNNRVAWRGDACLTDGQDIGRDLSGGWFDAGDHWTANLTMSFAAMTLAWSAVEQPKGWTQISQMEELLESLIHVNRYFLKCVLNPDSKDPAHELEVVIGCGGKDGVEPPNVHSMWASAEVAHLMTNRPTFRLNKDCPGGDIPAAMAAAMTASAMVIREHASVLAGRKGYEGFDAQTFAVELIDRAEKLTAFAHANMGPDITDKATKEEKEAIQQQRKRALRSDGKIVEVGYRAGAADKVFAAASWLARAAGDAAERQRWMQLAEEVHEGPYKAEFYHDWYRDSGWGNFGRVAAMNMLRLNPGNEKYHRELQLYAQMFTNYKATPGGLRLREWQAHEYGSLRHANNAAVIALYYSDLVEKAPALVGDTSWKKNLTNLQLKERFIQEAKRQVDYALGANPYRRSFLGGFGAQPFNDSHHRGAFGAWAGFNHSMKDKPERQEHARHILYGALIAGPDHNDVFLCGKESLRWLPLPDGSGHDFFYQFPNRTEPVRKSTYVWNSADQPVQDVMDSKFNEVALDYNAGITASFAWLIAHGKGANAPLPDADFPPKPERNESLDLWHTDREFLVTAKLVNDTAESTSLEATVWNRSRWPARVTDQFSFRYYFTHEGEVTATASFVGKPGTCTVKSTPDGRRYVEVKWPGELIYPGDYKTNSRSLKLQFKATGWNPADDWSHAGLDQDLRVIPQIPVYQAGTLIGGREP
jgi:endoglucanase